MKGLSEALAQPQDLPKITGDVLVQCLDAAGLSTGLLYLEDTGGRHRLQAQCGIPLEARAEAAACFGHPELIRRIVESGQPAALSVGSTGADDEVREFLARLGHACVLMIPLAVLGQDFGALVLASDIQDLSGTSWISFARNLASQFGQTVALGQPLTRLAASERRLRALIEQANDTILTLDPAHQILEDAVIMMNEQGLVVSWNARAEQLFGWTPDEAIGRTVSELIIPHRLREAHARGLRRLLATGEGTLIGRPIELRAVRRDGLEFPIELTVTALKDGEDLLFNAFVADITERKRADERRRESQDRLQHLVSWSPTVLYSLRPEGSVFVAEWMSENVERLLGYTAEEALLPGWWDSHLHPEERERVVAEQARIFVEGYLAHEYRFRLKNGGFRWLRAELRLLRDADGKPLEAVGSWSDVSARKEAELRLQKSEEQYRLLFESNPQPMWVFDEESLAFLAVNDAAVRHYGWSREEFLGMTIEDVRPPEEVPGRLEFVARSRREDHALDLETLGVWKHRKKDGTLIDVDGGTSPIVFLGRRAWLTLATDVTRERLKAELVQPQKMNLPTVEEAAPAEPPPVEDEGPRGTETILVVEDESALGEIVRECLEARGYTVLQALDGLAALELSKGHPGPIHLLVTDVVMPGLSGSELARRLTAQRPELKVLYMSGYTDDAVALYGVLTADMPLLEKPFTGSGLARRVREVLDRP